MDRREFVVSTIVGLAGLSGSSRLFAQPGAIALDLAAPAAASQLTLVNRTASPLTDGVRKGVRLSEGPGDGIAFLPGLEFSTGTIEFDVRGRDLGLWVGNNSGGDFANLTIAPA